MSGEICTDNRFEIIASYKKKLIEGTNIQESPEEIAVIDNILFRFWQMGWLPPIPHGRLIDADEFLKRAIGTKCFRGDYALMLDELVGESTAIIPAEEGET